MVVRVTSRPGPRPVGLPRWVVVPAVVGTLFVLVPLAALVAQVEWSDFWGLITSESSVSALALSLRTSAVSTLVCVLLGEATDLTGFWRWLGQTGVLVAAVLMPMGFFFSAMGTGRERPSRWVVLLPVGAAVLAAGVGTLGVGLLTTA